MYIYIFKKTSADSSEKGRASRKITGCGGFGNISIERNHILGMWSCDRCVDLARMPACFELTFQRLCFTVFLVNRLI